MKMWRGLPGAELGVLKQVFEFLVSVSGLGV
jgi:hypothetical protein